MSLFQAEFGLCNFATAKKQLIQNVFDVFIFIWKSKSKVMTKRIFLRQNSLSQIFAPWRCVCTSERFFLRICVDQNTKSIRASSGVNKFNTSIKLTLDSSGSRLSSCLLKFESFSYPSVAKDVKILVAKKLMSLVQAELEQTITSQKKRVYRV